MLSNIQLRYTLDPWQVLTPEQNFTFFVPMNEAWEKVVFHGLFFSFLGSTGAEGPDDGREPLAPAPVRFQAPLDPRSSANVHGFAGEDLRDDERREGHHTETKSM